MTYCIGLRHCVELNYIIMKIISMSAASFIIVIMIWPVFHLRLFPKNIQLIQKILTKIPTKNHKLAGAGIENSFLAVPVIRPFADWNKGIWIMPLNQKYPIFKWLLTSDHYQWKVEFRIRTGLEVIFRSFFMVFMVALFDFHRPI